MPLGGFAPECLTHYGELREGRESRSMLACRSSIHLQQVYVAFVLVVVREVFLVAFKVQFEFPRLGM